MSDASATAFVDIRPDLRNFGELLTRGIGGPLQDVGAKVEGLVTRFTRMNEGASGFGSTLEHAGGIAVASIAAIGVGAAAFAVKAAGTFRDVGGEVAKMQRILGGSAEEMSKLRFAAEESGVSTDQLTNAMKFLSKALEANKPIFDKYGISTKDAAGNSLSLHAVLLNVADQFARTANGAAKNTEAVALFGRAGLQLIPMLNRGRDGLIELENEAKKYGLVLTQDNIVAVKAATMAHREQTAAMQGLQVQIGAQVLPALTSLTKSFTEGLLVVMPAVSAIVRDLVVPAFGLLSGTVTTLGNLLGGHATLIKIVAEVIGTALVPAILAWAAAQAKALAYDVFWFLSRMAAAAVEGAQAMGLLTVATEEEGVALTSMGLAAGVGLGLAAVGLAVLTTAYAKGDAAATKFVASVVASAKTPEDALARIRAAIDALNAKLDQHHVPTWLRPYTQNMGALTEEYNKLSKQALPAVDAATDAVNSALTAQGLSITSLGQKTDLTRQQIEDLAASMGLDLTKPADQWIDKLMAQAVNLGYTSEATERLAHDNQILGDWTKDVTTKAAAFKDALDALVTTQVNVQSSAISYQQALANLSALTHDSTADVRAFQDAQQRVADTTQTLKDKQQALTDLEAKSLVDQVALVAAKKAVMDATVSLTDAVQRQSDAEQALIDITHPSALTREQAALGLSDAQNQLERSHIAVTNAQTNLDTLQKSGTATAQQMELAHLDLSDAENQVTRGVENLQAAQAKLNALTPQGITSSVAYATAQRNLRDANKGVVDAQQTLIDNNRKLMVVEQGDTTRATQIAALRRDVALAIRDQRRAGEDLVTAQDKLGQSTDITTDKGRKLQSTILAVITATTQAAAANIAAGGSLADQKAVIDAHIGKLREQLKQMGLNEQQIDGLIARYNLVPGRINTIVTMDDQASGRLKDVLQNINLLRGITLEGGPAAGHVQIHANAEGGIYDREQITHISEGNKREVVLPITNPTRANQLIDAAGIRNLFAPAAPAPSLSPASSRSSVTPALHIAQIGPFSVLPGQDPQAFAEAVARVVDAKIRAAFNDLLHQLQKGA